MANATAMIECLNKRLHEQTSGSEMNNINEILQRMREQMLSEFVKYKKDTEDSVNKVRIRNKVGRWGEASEAAARTMQQS